MRNTLKIIHFNRLRIQFRKSPGLNTYLFYSRAIIFFSLALYFSIATACISAAVSASSTISLPSMVSITSSIRHNAAEATIPVYQNRDMLFLFDHLLPDLKTLVSSSKLNTGRIIFFITVSNESLASNSRIVDFNTYPTIQSRLSRHTGILE